MAGQRVARGKQPANLLRALYNLGQTKNEKARNQLLQEGFKEFIKWFSLAASMFLQGKMLLPKQTQTFMDKHKDDVKKLASLLVDLETKRNIVLKRGGGGFLGGVIIRSLIRWDGVKAARNLPSWSAKGTEKQKRKPRGSNSKGKGKGKRKRPNTQFVTVRRGDSDHRRSQSRSTNNASSASSSNSSLSGMSPLVQSPGSVPSAASRGSTPLRRPSATLPVLQPLTSPLRIPSATLPVTPVRALTSTLPRTPDRSIRSGRSTMSPASNWSSDYMVGDIQLDSPVRPSPARRASSPGSTLSTPVRLSLIHI